MNNTPSLRGLKVKGALLVAAILAMASAGTSFGQSASETRLDIYGHAMLDMGYQTGQNHPDWFDVLRPTKLPAYEGEYGHDGRFFSGVRQSRLGVKTSTPTELGDLSTIFEFELFGTGVDAGQTTFRLRHAWGELGMIGAGQTWSPFMDIDVFPNSVEYWGPNAMVFFRNVQFRITPWQEGGSRAVIALERPGASSDRGIYSDRVELEGVSPRFPMPDLSGHFRHADDWGHVQVAGMLRYINWDDNGDDEIDLSGNLVGYGVNVSSNVNVAMHVLRLQVVYGAGIENYMNDAPVDVALAAPVVNPTTGSGIEAKAVPLIGVVAFLDLNWNTSWTSTVGGSWLQLDNTDGQADDAFKTGMYALGNILYHPAPNVFLGPEIQWGQRENFRDGFKSDDLRVQFSAKYNFNHSIGAK